MRLLLSAGLAAWCAATAFAQSTTTPLSFEVADVKVNKSGSREVKIDFLPGGRLTLVNITMKDMIVGAYKVGDNAISGGPAWLTVDRFDVIAKADPKTSEDDLRKMLQGLLAERFKLEAHREEKVMPVFAMVVGKKGLKMKEAAAGEQDCGQPQVARPPARSISCTKMSTGDLAEMLPRLAPRYITMPVVDLTGLKGVYDFTLSWTALALPGAPGGGRGGDAPAAGAPAPTEEPVPLGMFEALQEQLGLRLESRKHPLPIIVVDKIERLPTEN